MTSLLIYQKQLLYQTVRLLHPAELNYKTKLAVIDLLANFSTHLTAIIIADLNNLKYFNSHLFFIET